MRLPAYCKVIESAILKLALETMATSYCCNLRKGNPGRYLCHLSAMGTEEGLERGGSSLIVSIVANTNVKDHVNNTSLKDF